MASASLADLARSSFALRRLGETRRSIESLLGSAWAGGDITASGGAIAAGGGGITAGGGDITAGGEQATSEDGESRDESLVGSAALDECLRGGRTCWRSIERSASGDGGDELS